MRARIQQWIYHIQGSYWFVPSLMAIVAIVLSQVTVQLDHSLDSNWMNDAWWASLNQPEGARTLLATVAGSMITVAGVTFSLTILAVSYATSHFGPRLLDNFMRDRGNQITLGTFLATFLYCLLVLRTVRSGSDIFDPVGNAALFVPHLSVLIAIGLTLASVGVLIYFIHHVPESIHISNVLERISERLSDKIQDLYPEPLGEADDWDACYGAMMENEGEPIRSLRSGYLQGIDAGELIDAAKTCDAVLELHVRPGEFLLEGQEVASVRFATSVEPSRREDCASDILGALAMGASRTPTQDIDYIISQLFEIAVRAMSPGVNDPLTAIQCIDQIFKGLVKLSDRSIPSRFRKDSDGMLRVITTETDWGQIVDSALRRLIPYLRGDVYVMSHLRAKIEIVREISKNAELNQLLAQVMQETWSMEAAGSSISVGDNPPT